MIEDRIQEARATRTKALLREVQSLAEQEESTAIDSAIELRRRVWLYTQNGDLSGSSPATSSKNSSMTIGSGFLRSTRTKR